MNTTAQKLIQAQATTNDLLNLAARLFTFVWTDPEQTPSTLTATRLKTLLQSVNAWDDAVLLDFERHLKSGETAVRVTLFDLLNQLDLQDEDAQSIRHSQPVAELRWLALILVVHAYKSGYPIGNLDPSSPPAIHTPAGMILQQTGQFLRQQTVRSATEKDRLARKLSFSPQAAVPLEQMGTAEEIAPVLPHFRPPVPVNYPEYTDGVAVDEEEISTPQAPPTAQNATLTITADDLVPEEPPATSTPHRTAPIRITYDQIEQVNTPARPPAPARPQPTRRPAPATSDTVSNFSNALKNMFASEEMKSTRLKVVVQAFPEGPGLQAVQVRVSCKGIRSYVAGTTDRAGRFVCQLPVRANGGLTYDVEVTWPRDDGGDAEQKSITLSADRTEFALPFYQRTRV